MEDKFPFLQKKESLTTSLSFAQKKILLFVSIILKNPIIYLLDEPLAGLSEDYKILVIDIIKNIKDKIFIISEHNNDLDNFATEILYL
jgi:energy-coupling factor transporter ATP-binding protein EcfA2